MGSLRSISNTEWSVAQDRSYDRGDDDVFTRLQATGDDWIDLDDHSGQRVNLCLVTCVHLSFGTYARPNYQATLTDDIGNSVRVAGPWVLRLQDELLRRTKQHALLDRATMAEGHGVGKREVG
jgi:hypothetical protein